jgi:hypothetical protein
VIKCRKSAGRVVFVFGSEMYKEDDTVLDKECVSVLERTKRRVCEYSNWQVWVDREYRVQDSNV